MRSVIYFTYFADLLRCFVQLFRVAETEGTRFFFLLWCMASLGFQFINPHFLFVFHTRFTTLRHLIRSLCYSIELFSSYFLLSLARSQSAFSLFLVHPRSPSSTPSLWLSYFLSLPSSCLRSTFIPLAPSSRFIIIFSIYSDFMTDV